MSIITTSAIFRDLKSTLDNIITDPTKKDQLFPKWCEVKSMSDNYEDDAEVAGSLYLQEKPEGANAAIGTIQEGYTTRYIARTHALHMHIAEEAIEDGKYDKYVNAATRLTHSAYKTQDIDATNILIRSTNSAYVGGDGVVLGSASHTLPYGGTWSNIAGTYQTPSRAAVIAARAAVGKYPSPNGMIEGQQLEAILCPLAQLGAWEGIVGSELVPESANNEINVVKKMSLKVIEIKYWDAASTTAWGIKTDADNGFQWRNRRKIKSRTWVDNDAEIMKYGVSGRWARGYSDPRCWYQGNT